MKKYIKAEVEIIELPADIITESKDSPINGPFID